MELNQTNWPFLPNMFRFPTYSSIEGNYCGPLWDQNKNLSLIVWMMRNLSDCLTLVVQIMSLKMRIKYAKQLKSIKKAMIISAVSRLLEKLDGVKNIHTVILTSESRKKIMILFYFTNMKYIHRLNGYTTLSFHTWHQNIPHGPFTDLT